MVKTVIVHDDCGGIWLSHYRSPEGWYEETFCKALGRDEVLRLRCDKCGAEVRPVPECFTDMNAEQLDRFIHDNC